MNNQIKCPHCNKSFEPSEAYRHQMEEKTLEEITLRHQGELQKAIEQTKLQSKQESSKESSQMHEEIERLTKRAQEAEEEEMKMRKQKREFEEAKEKFEIESQRKLDKERDQIKKSVEQKIREEDRLKFAEYEKKISDMSKALDEAKMKGTKTSQQLQGEVLEEDFENLLRNTFADDEIIPVAKGKLGGDIIHKVKGKSGRTAGVILWETKRAKWSPKKWLPKLREDARSEDATFAVLLATELPSEIPDFQIMGGVVVCSYQSALPLAGVLRRSVLQLAVAKQTAVNKDEKLEFLYEYLQSETFRHRFESFAEGITEMQNDLSYERNAMERIWKRREVQIKKSLLNASRMYGELQGVMGNVLPDIKTFQLDSGEDEE